MIDNEMSDRAILSELGKRISRYRLNKNITQETLANEAGVSRSTVQRAESGTNIQIFDLIRILRGLDLLENLESFLPKPAVSPLQQLKMQGKVRKRARPDKKENKKEDWLWGDE
ncbi:MAG: helix-turn-helix domain-containing protein [Elusimicrobiota bacterium]